MKYLDKIKPSGSKGFSAVELILVVVVVMALGAIGFLAYRNSHNPSVAHAGSWEYIGQFNGATSVPGSQLPVVTVYACKINIDELGAPKYVVQDQVDLSSKLPSNGYFELVTMSGYSSINLNQVPGDPSVSTSNSNWGVNNSQVDSFIIAQNPRTYLGFFVTAGNDEKGGGGQIGQTQIASNLPKCK